MNAILIGLTCCCVASLAVPLAGASSDAAIRAARQAYNAAIARGDADAVAALLADNYVSVSSVGAQNHGREEARANYADIAKLGWSIVRTPGDVRVHEAWGAAQELGEWVVKRQRPTVATVRGVYAAKWLRTAQGEWRVQAEVFTALSCEGSAAACAPPPAPNRSR
jgi:ketosteroid isomerase-like protein